ncbi:MAG: ABC transporter permease subunit [Peptostreptococcaceae bacterium]
MRRLIKAEIYKLFKGKTFKILCSIATLLAVLVTVSSFTMTEERFMDGLGNISQEEKINSAKAFIESSKEAPIVNPGQLGLNTNGAENPFDVTPIEVFHVSFGVGVVEILISILVASMFAKEYSERTIKNTLAYGKKREAFYVAKLIAIVFGIAIIVGIMVLIPTIATTFIKGWIGNFELSHLIEIVRTYFGAMILYTAITSILMLIVTIVKSSGATIGISVALFIFMPTFLAFSYGQYDWFDKLYELTIFYNTALVTAIKSSSSDMLKAVSVGMITLLASGILGITIFKKQDIK